MVGCAWLPSSFAEAMEDKPKTPHFTDRNKNFLTFLKTFEITSIKKQDEYARKKLHLRLAFFFFPGYILSKNGKEFSYD